MTANDRSNSIANGPLWKSRIIHRCLIKKSCTGVPPPSLPPPLPGHDGNWPTCSNSCSHQYLLVIWAYYCTVSAFLRPLRGELRCAIIKSRQGDLEGVHTSIGRLYPHTIWAGGERASIRPAKIKLRKYKAAIWGWGLGWGERSGW